MKATQKISVSLAQEDVKWAKARAKALRTSVSSVLSEALRRQRKAEALRRLIGDMGGPEVTQEELDAVREEWR
jgi:hypothetical protein